MKHLACVVNVPPARKRGPRAYLIRHADEILQPRPQPAASYERAAEAQHADAARQQHRGKRHALARRPQEQGWCLRDLGEPVEHARAGEKRVVAGGNYRAEDDCIHKRCGGGCENRMMNKDHRRHKQRE